jgi:hypothetical protein
MSASAPTLTPADRARIRHAIRAYRRDDQTCPFCGGGITAGEMTGDGQSQYQETGCRDCGAEFCETYRMSAVTIDRMPTLDAIATARARATRTAEVAP